MFTGLIEMKGRIASKVPSGTGFAFEIQADAEFANSLHLGDSVAVDGACMTVTQVSRDGFVFDASPESISKTTLRARKVGDGVHLERALRVGDRLGGHFVSGHVDGLATVISKTPAGTAISMRLGLPAPLLRYVIEKGSIALDGVSLTVNEVHHDGISVMLIPHTQSVVALHEQKLGSSINVEVDQIGKYVERLLSPKLGTASQSGLTEEKLKALGYTL